MFRQIISAVFFLAFFMQTFSKAVIAINFYVNQNEIAKTLCENRAKPQMKCSGKCQLAKRLKQQDKKDNKETGLKPGNKSEVAYSRSFFPEYIFSPVLAKIMYDRMPVVRPIDQSFKLLRPPSGLI